MYVKPHYLNDNSDSYLSLPTFWPPPLQYIHASILKICLHSILSLSFIPFLSPPVIYLKI